MAQNLYQLLEHDDPVALRHIEKALSAEDAPNETVETVLSALLWRRCTMGQNGILGALLNHECAARVSVMDEHLDVIGASDAAQAMRDLRTEIPLQDEHIRRGIIDWVYANQNLVEHAKTLNEENLDVAPNVWTFMQKRKANLPNIEIPDKRTGLLARLFG
ncbi:hypothetical protein [Tateyamaria pelophila]|uniref:hypothetical protein n=1 Tax=Tateyamaria pelophila TaxID=328415 RepID=UPI001CBDC27B|nr:hypothetical protein [Tateyamaria pelophila]